MCSFKYDPEPGGKCKAAQARDIQLTIPPETRFSVEKCSHPNIASHFALYGVLAVCLRCNDLCDLRAGQRFQSTSTLESQIQIEILFLLYFSQLLEYQIYKCHVTPVIDSNKNLESADSPVHLPQLSNVALFSLGSDLEPKIPHQVGQQ